MLKHIKDIICDALYIGHYNTGHILTQYPMFCAQL